jgi:hypothetical protein
MMFRDEFRTPRYDDAPFLSDQLLLPNLVNGNDLFLVSAFVPSYIQRLVKDLAESPEIEPGHLTMVFYVPGDLTNPEHGLVRFRRYLEDSLANRVAVANFVDDCLQLLDEGGLTLQLLHGPPGKAVTSGCFGVIVNRDNNDYVGVEDSKGGDYNSPVHPKRSWDNSELPAAEKILLRMRKLMEGRKADTLLLSRQGTADWLSGLATWFENQDSIDDENGERGSLQANGFSDSEAKPSDQVYDQEFAEFVEAQIEDWEIDQEYMSEIEDVTEFFSTGYSLFVSPSEVEGHHVPPLPEGIAYLVGPAGAVCVCGRSFRRANGCDAVVW